MLMVQFRTLEPAVNYTRYRAIRTIWNVTVRLARAKELFYTEAMPKSSSVPSVLDPRCPSRLVLDRIADKWTALVIQILAGGTMRYAALQREIGGISQKMLTQTLRSLERDGLVQRTVHPVIPPKVEYSLTKLGRTLIEPLQGLCRWSEKHLAELQANRARAKAVAAGVDHGK